MSDFRAIGSVSATLQRLLRDRMELPSGVLSVPVTVSTPRSEDENGQTVEDPRVNLFLYQVPENGGLKNQTLPGHGYPGANGHPPLSLNLHYLLTAYGLTSEAEGVFVNATLAHYLLGSAMRVLHDYPIITEQLTTVREPSGELILDQSLRGSFEQVKICLDLVSLKEVSDVWLALTLPYRLSAAYMVSVVQIESQRARRYPKPVGAPPDAGPRVTVVTLSTPTIDQVRIKRQETLNETTVPYAAVSLTPTVIETQRLEVEITDDDALQPGAQPVNLGHGPLFRPCRQRGTRRSYAPATPIPW